MHWNTTKAKRKLSPNSLTQLERDKLVEENLGLIGFTIHHRGFVKYIGMGSITFEDMFQEGCFGLMRAAVFYDSSRGKFGTFAVWCIGNLLVKYTQRSLSKAVTLPENSLYNQGKRKDKRGKLQEKLLKAMAPPAKFDECRQSTMMARRLREEERDRIVTASDTMAEMLVENPRINDRAKVILTQHYLLGYGVREIGAMHGISKARVGQIMNRCRRILRKWHPEEVGLW